MRVDYKLKRLGVVGHPVSHSLSPAMHNAVFKELGLDCSYERFDVSPGDLGDFIKDASSGDFLGLNVTVPHKVEVLRYVDVLSRGAELVSAVNTIKFGGNVIEGHNTDGAGCVNALRDAGVNVSGKKAVVLGAGGASRAICFQLALENALITIANRSRDKAESLAADLAEKADANVRVVDLSVEGLACELADADVIINTTSVGMSPRTEESVIPASVIPEGAVVMDIVYNPLETILLRNARAKGCRVIDGVGMLVHQGAESLRIWLGIDPPLDVMQKAVRDELGKRDG